MVFLIYAHFYAHFFIQQKRLDMQMTLITNTDTSARLAYKVARVVYVHTKGASLPLVEAFTSMIKNLSNATGLEISTLIQDASYFPALGSSSVGDVSGDNRAFQMCVRTAQRMLSGGLGDCCFGATRFHNADVIPEWARARGYIADIDGILFYR